MTFNIRYGTAPDGPNHWDLRREILAGVLHRHQADFYGVQEALPFQLQYLQDVLPGHGMIGRPRDAALQGEAVAIYYDRARWNLLRQGHFWLSEQPDTEGSMSWGAVFPRIVTWGKFELKDSGRQVWVFNTHYSHVSDSARHMSSRLLAKRISELTGDERVIIMGDLNATEDARPIRTLAGVYSDAYRQVNRSAPGETFFGWEPHIVGKGVRIDYIFLSPALRVLDCRVVEDNHGGRYPSDHNPVYAVLAAD
jgi:endonuclease/exonuclease/phosphatase family metal-dependent hydrolase